MEIKIGFKYEETKEKLKRKIINGNIIMLEIDNIDFDCCCYFCRNNIKGRGLMLVDREVINGVEHKDKYFIDDECYMGLNAKLN